jgi:tRNA-dependent cyclodipeptide synthase
MIKVLPKGGQAWRGRTTACVGISMESRNHRDDVMSGLLHWAGRNFERLIVDLSDTLHRYNFIAKGLSEAAAHDKALSLGDDWLRDHQALLHAVPVPARIVRWDEWLAHGDYPDIHARFTRAFHEQPAFHKAVLTDAATFYRRKSFVMPAPDDIRMRCSVDYLLEEISVHSIVYAENPCAILYPGKQHSCYRLVREGRVDGVPNGLANSVYTRMMVYNFGALFDRHVHAA